MIDQDDIAPRHADGFQELTLLIDGAQAQREVQGVLGRPGDFHDRLMAEVVDSWFDTGQTHRLPVEAVGVLRDAGVWTEDLFEDQDVTRFQVERPGAVTVLDVVHGALAT